MNVVIRVNDEIKQKMIEYYKDKVRDKKIPYVVFQAQEEDTVITMYESGKVMFQGTSADVDASMWGVALEKSKDKEKPKTDEKYHNCSSVGSDEVGTGDYFGPIVVTASYVTKDDVSFLDELGVGDSKKINDEKIDINAKELEILKFLLDNEGQALTRMQIIDNVWKETEEIPYDRVIDVYIKELRKKLGLDCIITIRNVGYKLERK